MCISVVKEKDSQCVPTAILIDILVNCMMPQKCTDIGFCSKVSGAWFGMHILFCFILTFKNLINDQNVHVLCHALF